MQKVINMVALGRVRRNKLFYSVQQFTDSLQHLSLQQLLLHSPVLQPSLQQPSAQQVSLQQVSTLSVCSIIIVFSIILIIKRQPSLQLTVNIYDLNFNYFSIFIAFIDYKKFVSFRGGVLSSTTLIVLLHTFSSKSLCFFYLR